MHMPGILVPSFGRAQGGILFQDIVALPPHHDLPAFPDNGVLSRMARTLPRGQRILPSSRCRGPGGVSTGVGEVPHLVLRLEAGEDRSVGPMFPRTQEARALSWAGRRSRSGPRLTTSVRTASGDLESAEHEPSSPPQFR